MHSGDPNSGSCALGSRALSTEPSPQPEKLCFPAVCCVWNLGPCSCRVSPVPPNCVPRPPAMLEFQMLISLPNPRLSHAPKLFSLRLKVAARSPFPFSPCWPFCFTSCLLVHPPVQPDFSAFLSHLPVDSSVSLNMLFPSWETPFPLGRANLPDFSAQLSSLPETPWVKSATLPFALSTT